MTTVEDAVQATSSSIEERVLVMCELAETGWALRGLPLPEYTRATMPGRVLRVGVDA